MKSKARVLGFLSVLALITATVIYALPASKVMCTDANGVADSCDVSRSELNLGERIAVSSLADTGAAAGDILSVANPLGATVVVNRLVLDISTGSTAASTIDCGIASGAAVSSDTLIDGVSLTSLGGTFDNIENQGTNGVGAARMTSSQYLTCSEASGDTAGLVGKAYIYYTPR